MRWILDCIVYALRTEVWAVWVHGRWVWLSNENGDQRQFGPIPSRTHGPFRLFAWTWMKVNIDTSRNEPKNFVSRKNSRISLPYPFLFFLFFYIVRLRGILWTPSLFRPLISFLSRSSYRRASRCVGVLSFFLSFCFGKMAKVAPVQRY